MGKWQSFIIGLLACAFFLTTHQAKGQDKPANALILPHLELNGGNNAAVDEFTLNAPFSDFCAPMTLAPAFWLSNLGANTLTSANLQLQINGINALVQGWNGQLSTLQSQWIQLQPVVLDGPGIITLVVADVNGGSDDDPSNNSAVAEISKAPKILSDKMVLKLKTDEYSAEIYWELRDDQGQVLDHGGNEAVGPDGGGAFQNPQIQGGPGAYPSHTLIVDTLLLPEFGCYSLHFVDGFGDGICCAYGNGYYKLYDAANFNTPLLEGGHYGAYENRALERKDMLAGLEGNTDIFTLKILNQPVLDDNLQVQITAPRHVEMVNLAVIDISGKMIFQMNRSIAAGTTRMEIPVAACPAGTYFLRSVLSGSVQTRIFQIVR